MTAKIEIEDVEEIILTALKEDIGDSDITTEAIISAGDASKAIIIAKDSGIFCGMDMVKFIYGYIDPAIKVVPLISDGDAVIPGDEIVLITGPTGGILSGERVVLNFIQRMSGIATMTSHFVAMTLGSNIKILDTRKTLPGLRLLDKYAVRIGRGTNHRMGLYDMVMIKDNHIRAAGNITKAVVLVREAYGSTYRVEVETTTLKEVKEAVEAGADIIMLDNMNKKTMQKAVNLISGKTEIEVSGNVDLKKIKELLDLDINYISVGALTHSVKAFDLSMKFILSSS